MEQISSVLHATYFDGKSALARPVELRIVGADLRISLADSTLEVPVKQVRWPERTRHGKRMAELPGGGMLQCADITAWDAWCKAAGLREPGVVMLQQSWRWVAGTIVSMVLVLAALYQWGLPVAAQAVVAVTPHSVDEAIGKSTLSTVDDVLMEPTELTLQQQEAIRTAFQDALKAQQPDDIPPWNLQFRKSKIGPNALALPGGTILMTDDMVTLVDGDTQVLTAVLAHELGHVKHRHGLRMLVQVSALGAITSLMLGDFSTALAAVPALMGQAYYSREAEREADAHSLQVLQAAGIQPKVMVTLFTRMEAKRQSTREKSTKDGTHDEVEQRAGEAVSWLGIAFASHPADAERIAFFSGNVP